ncbi:MAG: hypothetical protein M3406_12120 [Chloroflexota bacterium]|nr:hypothetical protein [Chloroflexota bacterium]
MTRPTQRIAAALSATALLIGLSAGSVLAGEVTGTGEPTPVNGYVMKSICAFSGQNDGNPPPGRTAAHVQNWGQISKETREIYTTIGRHPGDACNGHTGFLAGDE